MNMKNTNTVSRRSIQLNFILWLFSLVIICPWCAHVFAANDDALFIDEKGKVNMQELEVTDKVKTQELDVTGNAVISEDAAINGNALIGGNVGIGLKPTKMKLEILQNEAIKVGNAYLSSGGDYAHLANNEWYDGKKWQETGSGALIQLFGQEVHIYAHDGKGNHTKLVSVAANGMTVEGSLHYQGTYQKNDEQAKTRTISPRYHLTLTAPSYSGSSKMIPQETLLDLCGDEDGCQVRLGMTKWSNDTNTETASRSFLFYYASNGRWRSEYGDKAGVDADGKTNHAADPWHMCHFTDGHYSKFTDQGDSQKGMELLMWKGKKGQYQGPNRTCELTLID